jgi:hypothetical protein
LLEGGLRAGLSVTQGVTVTTDTPLLRVEQKQSVYSELGAIAVDMEATAVAAVAASGALPFACARVILDEATTNVPSLDGLADKHGSLRPLRIAAHAVARPGDIPHFMALGRNSRVAEAALELLFRIVI